MRKIKMFLLLILVVLSAIGWLKALDYQVALETCSIEEMRIHSDRDFLIELFKLAGVAQNRAQLLTALEAKYASPSAHLQVAVTKVDDGIIWGSYKISLNDADKILSVRELTQKELSSLPN